MVQTALSAPPSFWLAVGWLVLFCTVFAFAVWYWALKRLGATETAVFIYLIPALGILCGSLLVAVPITRSLIAGGAAFLAGIYLGNYSAPGTEE
jgi:drug/metabolite transporter (DMT)-like permease